MRLAIVWDWCPDFGQAITWKDGLAKAIQLLCTRHEVRLFTFGPHVFTIPHPYFPIEVFPSDSAYLSAELTRWKPDAILHWADATRPHASIGTELGIPQALCFAGGNTQGETIVHFDHVFCENEVYRQRFEAQGVSASIAFGTNEELFDPDALMLRNQSKVFDVVNTSTFAEWKNHALLSKACQGLRFVCSGFMYDTHEMECWQVPQGYGALVLPHMSAEGCAALLAASHVAVYPSRSDGGSQRSVLEAMAMNVPVVVCDSDKLSEYVREAGESAGMIVASRPEAIRDAIDHYMENPTHGGRSYILSKWTSRHYATALEEGLKSIL